MVQTTPSSISTQAYAELRQSRADVPDVLQFYGMEFNMPGMDHHTLIIPHVDFEALSLVRPRTAVRCERSVSCRSVSPHRRRARGPRSPTCRRCRACRSFSPIIHRDPRKGLAHSARTNPGKSAENNDLAPEVYRGMEGAPGHQAGEFVALDGAPPVVAGPARRQPADRRARRLSQCWCAHTPAGSIR